MKITINKFLITFFTLTSIIPITTLGFIHINYLHRILNHNKSFLKLIEHEEVMLFGIYFLIVAIAITLCLYLLNQLVISPFREALAELKRIAKGESPEEIEIKSFQLQEVKNFLADFNEMTRTVNQAKKTKSRIHLHSKP